MARQQNEFERFTCRIKEKGAAIFIAAPSRCPGKDSNLHIITDTKTASRRESESPVSEKRPALGGSPVRRSVKPHSPNGRKAGEHRKQATILAVRSRPDPHSGNGAPRPIDRETVCLALPKGPWQRMARQQNEFERFTCRIKEKGAAIFIAAPSRCPGKDSNLHIITDTST